MLISVLRSAVDADEVVMRLAKRGHDPLLSFAIVMTVRNSMLDGNLRCRDN